MSLNKRTDFNITFCSAERNTSKLSHFIYLPDFDMEVSEYYSIEVCTNLKNAKCPLQKGDTVTYGFKMPVYSQFAGYKTDLKICFKDDQEYVVFCFAITVDVRDQISQNNE